MDHFNPGYHESCFSKFNELDQIIVYDTQVNPKKNIISEKTNCKLIGYKKGKILKIFDNELIVKYDCDEIMEHVNKYDINIFRIHKLSDTICIIPNIDDIYDGIFMF